MTDLLVTAFTPALTSGTGLRTYGVTAALARDHEVEIAYVVWGAPAPAAEYQQLGNVTLRALEASRGPRRVLEYALARRRGVPRDLARGVSPTLAAAARFAQPEVRVIADGPVVAAALLPLARRRHVIYLAHNLESGRLRHSPSSAVLERFERDVLRTFAECWMATRSDERGARQLAGEEVSTRYVPNVVDTGRVRPVRPARAARLLFVGDLTYEPNVKAFGFLTDRVLPAVWEQRPDVRLTVVGRGPVEAPYDPRVQVLGFVEDLSAVYAAADIVLVPLRHGGGSPLKFIEGLAYGLPVVASSHAARLLDDAVPGRDFITADAPGDFAAAIDVLLGDPVRAAALGASGRELAVSTYSVDALVCLLSGRAQAADNQCQ